MRAVVCFHDHGDGYLSRLLKPGFRHVFILVDDGTYWIAIDGRAGLPVVRVEAARVFDIAEHYRAQGMTVVEATQAATAPSRLFAPCNCVGLVAGILGLSCRAITPWQIYRHLMKDKR